MGGAKSLPTKKKNEGMVGSGTVSGRTFPLEGVVRRFGVCGRRLKVRIAEVFWRMVDIGGEVLWRLPIGTTDLTVGLRGIS